MKGLNVFPEAKFSLRPTSHGLPLGFVYLEELFSLLVGHITSSVTLEIKTHLTVLCGHKSTMGVNCLLPLN